MKTPNIFFSDTALGRIGICSEGDFVTAVYLPGESPKDISLYIIRETGTIKQAFKELNEYLNGKRKIFTLLLRPQGTDFQERVWQSLREIPYGQTRTYGQIAKSAGDPEAIRAAGIAINKNPIAIFIPGHRVAGRGGKLTGFRGGLEMKNMLIQLEKENVGK